MRSFILVGICSTVFIYWGCLSLYSQGGDLIIQQYNKGPVLDNVYSRWSIYPVVQLNRINSNLETTTPKIALGGGLEGEYQVSKTLGFLTGMYYNPVIYSYPVQDSLGFDRLSYLSLPFAIRLHPTKSVSLGVGIHYNFYRKGEQLRTIGDFERTEPYAEGIFKNSFGGFAQVGYHFFKHFYGFVNFRWAGRSSPPIQPQTNNISGFQVGFNYRIWRSRIKR